MERAKIKNIVIIVLLLLNLFFVANMLLGGAYAESLDQSELDDLSSVLARQGVSLEENALPDRVLRIGPLETRRDTAKEQQAAVTLLGACSVEQLGGGLVAYTSEHGRAVFRQNYEFEIEINTADIYTNTGDGTAKKLETLLDAAGFEVELGEYQKSDGNYVFNAPQVIGGINVFNLGIKAVVSSDGRLQLSGRWAQAYGSIPNSERSMSAASLAVPFAAYARERFKVEAISRADYRYYLAQSPSGGFSLTPACEILTDKGVFCVNALRFETLATPDSVK